MKKKTKAIMAGILTMVVLGSGVAVYAGSQMNDNFQSDYELTTEQDEVTEEKAEHKYETKVDEKDVTTEERKEKEQKDEIKSEKKTKEQAKEKEENISPAKYEKQISNSEVKTEKKSEQQETVQEEISQPSLSEGNQHEHSWVWIVDQAAYDEEIYEEQPVYEEKPVYEEQYVGYHWECYLYGVRTPYMDCIEYADAVVGRNLEGGTLNPEYQAAIGYYCGGCDQVPVDDYETVQVGTEKVQTGTERVKTGTQHHDEVGHYECSCGAVQ